MTKKSAPSLLRALFELFSSMRFAISALTVLAIASIVGTVLKQNEPYVNYRIEFGDFWFGIFEKLGVFDVYHSVWFLLILAFLLMSTSLCIWRHAPGMLREMKSYREKASEKSLRLIHLHMELPSRLDATKVGEILGQQGYRFKVRETADAVMLAAKKGNWQRLGYLFAHMAIVVICIGGLMDGNLPLKLMELAGNKTPEMRDVPQSQIPEQSRLAQNNLSFRGNVTLPEGEGAGVVFLNAGNGYFVQELPFILRLKQFHVDYYSTGMPKLFASDIEVLDKQSGQLIKRGTVEVNHPLVVDGVAIYQASFGDGGSGLEFAQWDLATGVVQPLKFRSQDRQTLTLGGQSYQLETGDLKVFNIQNMGREAADGQGLQAAMAAARSVKGEHNLRNLGPTIEFKLRDDAGQAVQYQNYLQPYEDNGALYYLTGIRREISEPFAYIRIPLDSDNQIATFMQLRQVLLAKDAWPEIARRTAAKARDGGGVSAKGEMQFAAVTEGVLAQFAKGGFPAIDRFIEQRVPQPQRQAVAQTYLKILQGAVVDAMDLARQRAGLAAMEMNPERYRFMMDSLVATSALFEYGAPAMLQLTGFHEVKASGFQLTRSPGKNVVFLGSILLIAGIFCMFYIRENRVWVRIAPQGTLVAMSSNRKSADLEREFAALVAVIEKETQA